MVGFVGVFALKRNLKRIELSFFAREKMRAKRASSTAVSFFRLSELIRPKGGSTNVCFLFSFFSFGEGEAEVESQKAISAKAGIAKRMTPASAVTCGAFFVNKKSHLDCGHIPT